MDFFDKLLSNSIVMENVLMLVGVLGCFLFSTLFNSKYNHGGSRIWLMISRLLIVAAGILVIIWIF